MALPPKSWFTIVDLSRRWKIPEADVEHYIETNKLKAELRQGSISDPPTESNRLREYVASRVRISVLPGVILLGGEYVVVVPAEVRRFETQYGLNVSADVSDPSKDPQKNPKRTALQSFIKKEGAWMITYEGREDIIGNLLGLQYIAYLLERPGESVSCINLYKAVNPQDYPTITKERAAEEGLPIATRSREVEAINTAQAKKELGKKYRQLQADYDNAESDIERNETEKEMEAIMKALKNGRFPDPINSKAQANIKKSITRAITAIGQSKLKALAPYLKEHIKPDGKYGYVYTGALWEIIP